MVVKPRLEVILSSPDSSPGESSAVPQSRYLFDSSEKAEVAKAVLEVLPRFETLRGTDELQQEHVQAEIRDAIQEIARPKLGGVIYDALGDEEIAAVIKETTAAYRELSIDIPKIVVVPKGKAVARFEDFDLDTSSIHLQPVAENILIQHLHDHRRFTLQDGSGVIEERRPEDYLVRGLIDYDDISYDDHAALLYKLAGQLVARLRSYLPDEEAVENVLQYHQQALVKLIHAQMGEHFTVSATEYEAHVTKGFRTLRPNNYTAAANEETRDFRTPIPDGEKNRIGSMLFGGFRKCLYPIQKFDTDPERRLSVILENDAEVLKWFKPAKGDFQIHYSHDHAYEPDFVVETRTCKFICEPKRATDMTDETVLAKANAALTWCKYASVHARKHNGKPWKYLLIPHDQISEQMTLAGLEARFTYVPRK